ncbi:MAG TPA: DNA repair protein RecO [Pyrinomonadaceae bacterium]|nr:DNA repair protein RecO [Pyrinomonadaceae bacterium]
MGVAETEAIVLRTYKLAEADKIIVFLTQHSGVMRGVARGARRLKSKFGASLEPFTLIGLSYFEKEGQELVSIRQAEILRSYFELSRNTDAVNALEYLAGLILEFTPPHEPNEKIFRMFKACLEATLSAPEDLRQITRYGEVWLLKLAGFLPGLHACVNCKKVFDENNAKTFLGIDGALRCVSCSHKADMPLSREATARLRATERQSPAVWARGGEATTETARKELSQLTQRLITRALERLPRGRATVE